MTKIKNYDFKTSKDDMGLIHGYKPNRISLYIVLLNANRLEELNDLLYKDMEEYKIQNSELALKHL